MDKYLKLVEETESIVVVENLCKTPLEVAKNPELPLNYAYFTITKGKKHIFTVTKKDGSTWNFDWGGSSCTMISPSVHHLKERVLAFLEESGVFLELTTPIQEMSVSEMGGEGRLVLRGGKDEAQCLYAPSESEAMHKGELIAGKPLDWKPWENGHYHGWEAKV